MILVIVAVSRRHVDTTIVVEEEVRVDSPLVDIDRVAPRVLIPDVIRLDVHRPRVACHLVWRADGIEDCADEVEGAVVVTQGRREVTTTGSCATKVEL
jgi:hypothetical protein